MMGLAASVTSSPNASAGWPAGAPPAGGVAGAAGGAGAVEEAGWARGDTLATMVSTATASAMAVGLKSHIIEISCEERRAPGADRVYHTASTTPRPPVGSRLRHCAAMR